MISENSTPTTLASLSENLRSEFENQKAILSFDEYLDILKTKPQNLTRSCSRYIIDTFNFFGTESIPTSKNRTKERYKLFDHKNATAGPIVGGFEVQSDIFRILESFDRQGFVNKLILLHGPNGSSKTTTIEMIIAAMEKYSKEPDGAVYTFNWIFPSEKDTGPSTEFDTSPIGFAGARTESDVMRYTTYAHMDEQKIASRVQSEYHDNPIFLLPMPHREAMIRSFLAKEQGIEEKNVEIPPHILGPGLSKKNQMIFETLLNAYDGDFEKVMRHVQVERFYYSKTYRVGVSTVEPQMSIDAAEKQLTMDRNIQNLPAYLQNLRFFESFGPLVEANRGIIEFSDMLKRPVETFKYLLTTVEKRTISLPTSTAYLDTVFFATTNDKHLDAFTQMPDFSSFRSRFELVTVPYLLIPSLEEKIYDPDIQIVAKQKPVCKQAISCLAKWAVLTRLKQPDRSKYDKKVQGTVTKMTPWVKLKLYDSRNLQPELNAQEEAFAHEIKAFILAESKGATVYEGRFGASPREIRSLLYRAAHNNQYKTLTPMAIFSELRMLVKNKAVYEFLQYEARAGYHDSESFISIVEKDFCDAFEHELLMAMSLVEDTEYENHLTRYIENVVGYLKNEKIQSQNSHSYEDASTSLMNETEKVLGVTGSIDKHRQNILTRIAAYKIDHPQNAIVISTIFADELRRIQNHYHNEKKAIVEKRAQSMLALATNNKDDTSTLDKKEIQEAKDVFTRLEERFGYDKISAEDCLKFVWQRRLAPKTTASS